MYIKINGSNIAEMPAEFTVTTLDIDDADTSVRTANGTLNRDRITVKRQIEMSWNALDWATTSALMQSISGVFFDITYPDPVTGKYETKTFYAGNRPCPVAIAKGDTIVWSGIKVTFTER